MKYRWLLWLIAVTLIAVIVPFIGMAFPRWEVLRGLFLTWIFVFQAWIIVIFYHSLKLVTGAPRKD